LERYWTPEQLADPNWRRSQSFPVPEGATVVRPPLTAGDCERLFGGSAHEALDDARNLIKYDLPMEALKPIAERAMEAVAVGSVIFVGRYAFRVAKSWWFGGKKLVPIGICFVAGTSVLLGDVPIVQDIAAWPAQIPDDPRSPWPRVWCVSAALGLALLAGFYQCAERRPRRPGEEPTSDEEPEAMVP
jgi:hypothetical protein